LKDWDGSGLCQKKSRIAGITPITVGAQDNGPTFLWSYLVVRQVGQAAFERHVPVEGADGFAGAPFLRAGRCFLDLGGWRALRWLLEPIFFFWFFGGPSGKFCDGKQALHLIGNWDLRFQT